MGCQGWDGGSKKNIKMTNSFCLMLYILLSFASIIFLMSFILFFGSSTPIGMGNLVKQFGFVPLARVC